LLIGVPVQNSTKEPSGKKAAGIILKLKGLLSKRREDDYKVKSVHKAKRVLYEFNYHSVHCIVSVQIDLVNSFPFSGMKSN